MLNLHAAAVEQFEFAIKRTEPDAEFREDRVTVARALVEESDQVVEPRGPRKCDMHRGTSTAADGAFHGGRSFPPGLGSATLASIPVEKKIAPRTFPRSVQPSNPGGSPKGFEGVPILQILTILTINSCGWKKLPIIKNGPSKCQGTGELEADASGTPRLGGLNGSGLGSE